MQEERQKRYKAIKELCIRTQLKELTRRIPGTLVVKQSQSCGLFTLFIIVLALMECSRSQNLQKQYYLIPILIFQYVKYWNQY